MKTLLLFCCLVSLALADVSQVVTIGSKWNLTATFVRPDLNPPETIYRIQWLKDLRGISGATSSLLVITINSTEDLGTYQFKVTADCKGTLSEVVTSDKCIVKLLVAPPTEVRAGIAPAPVPTPVTP